MTRPTTRNKALDRLRFANSYTRLGILVRLADTMRYGAWLRLLGEQWSTCDNIAEHRDDLQCLLVEIDTRPMMTAAERRKLASLPDTITIYRGCYEYNVRGLSWSLDRDTAAKFPTLNRYRQPGQPLLVTATIPRDMIFALKLDRGELEVIVDLDAVAITSTEQLAVLVD